MIKVFVTAACWGSVLAGSALVAGAQTTGELAGIVRDANAPVFDIPDDFWSVRTNDLAEGRNRQRGASARLTVRLGDTATLASLTAYRDGEGRLFVDSDTTEWAVATTRTSGIQRQVS